uniref:Uncharacterized protein n=1 Tax=Moniliophthora roreri TaxID=221103 RepID=A0A0W0GED4_MONRR
MKEDELKELIKATVEYMKSLNQPGPSFSSRLTVQTWRCHRCRGTKAANSYREKEGIPIFSYKRYYESSMGYKVINVDSSESEPEVTELKTTQPALVHVLQRKEVIVLDSDSDSAVELLPIPKHKRIRSTRPQPAKDSPPVSRAESIPASHTEVIVEGKPDYTPGGAIVERPKPSPEYYSLSPQWMRSFLDGSIALPAPRKPRSRKRHAVRLDHVELKLDLLQLH